ncbi:MAG: triose-phosphate isomerase [Sphingomonas sp. 12-62-6]|nr:MAG: triose-phosphate isomerase [Sphingomonas sp. 12-62-6]
MRKLIVGNWKMNGSLASLAEIDAIAQAGQDYPKVDVGLALPATLFAPAAAHAGGLIIGAQDVHARPSGAFTGSLSAAMLCEAGARLTIVGHSERRAMQGETDADVQAKAMAGLAAGLHVILCVGETLAEREAGLAESVVASQLEFSLPGDADPAKLAIAYEPIWAIGTGKVASVADVAAMHAAIRAKLAELTGPRAAQFRVLYGGSVTADNAPGLLATADVDGALVGGASLTAANFVPIIAAAAL